MRLNESGKPFNIKADQEKAIKTEMGYPRGVMVKAMDCGIVVREFGLQLRVEMPLNKETKPNQTKTEMSEIELLRVKKNN